MLSSILRCNMQFFESTPIGRIINRFSKDIEFTETKIPESFKSSIRLAFNVFSVIAVVLITLPLFIVFLVPLFIIYFLIQRFYLHFSRQVKRLDSASSSHIYSFCGESLNGLSTIRAFKAQNRFVTQMQKHIDKNFTIFNSNFTSARWLGLRLELTGCLVVVLTSLLAVLKKDSISPGEAGLSITYALSITQVLMWMVRTFSDFETHIISVERIKEYCEFDETAKELPWDIAATKPPNNWPLIGNIKFENYSVRYRKGLDFVLKNLNIEVKGGEKIGIVGRTGAGKSSLALSLFRILEDSEGAILIDGINIKSLGLHDLRTKLTIIPQDPVLFSGSIRMNLDPFESFNDNELWDVLEKTHLKSLVKGLENGLHFECSEGAENLSVGQRQLFCLARALLRKSKILILDEATAAIDHNTDELIQKAIRTSFADCTVLTIAHRLNTILDSTRIIVLNNGEILEYDSPSKLLANKNSQFYSLVEAAGLIQINP